MKFTRQNFIDYVFQPYNAAVKRNEYEKISYADWKTIRGWAYDAAWDDYHIHVLISTDEVAIVPWHDERVVPEPIILYKGDSDYADWLVHHQNSLEMWDEDFSSRVMSQCTISNTYLVESNYTPAYACSTHSLNSDSVTKATIQLDSNGIYIGGESLQEHIEKLIKVVDNTEKEKNDMKFGNFDFGPVDSSVRLSMYGMAIKNSAGKYVAYDRATEQIMDVDILNFEGANKFMYKMPVAIDAIEVGDVVVHNRLPMFVQEVMGDNRLSVLDVYHGEEKTVVLSKSMFNFDFITKVVSLVDFAGTADKYNPFGNMLPLLLLGDGNAKDMLPLMFLMNQSGSGVNPMMLYALMGDRKSDDMLPLLMMSGAFTAPQAKPKTPCGGGCDCKHEE